MSLFLISGTYRRNFTSPFLGWHKGTAFQIEKHEHIWMQDSELEAEMIILTMAAKITQSLFFLARNILHNMGWHLKLLPSARMTIFYRRVQCWGWRVVESLSITRHVPNKNYSRSQLLCLTDVSMSSSYIKNDSCDYLEMSNPVPEEVASKDSVDLQDVDLLETEDEFMDRMISFPSEDDSGVKEENTPVNESEVSCRSEIEDEATSRNNEESSFTEDMSADSDMHKPWTPGTRDGIDHDQESNRSEDFWDTEYDADWAKEGFEVWSSAWKNDPYHPLPISMPPKSVSIITEDPESYCEGKNEVRSILRRGRHDDAKNEGSTEKSTSKIKRVRFSLVVNVRPMRTTYADRAARRGPWQEYAWARRCFEWRIAEAQVVIGSCLEPHHREKAWARLHELAPAVYAEDSTI